MRQSAACGSNLNSFIPSRERQVESHGQDPHQRPVAGVEFARQSRLGRVDAGIKPEACLPGGVAYIEDFSVRRPTRVTHPRHESGRLIVVVDACFRQTHR